MPDSQFYKDLKNFDAGIADRWKRATKDNPALKLTDAMMITIVGWTTKTVEKTDIKFPAYDRQFSENQAKAIVLLLDKMDSAAKDQFILYLNIADTNDLLFQKGVMKRLRTPDELKRVTDFVTTSVSRISWVSPGSKFGYFALQYTAIVELIKDKKIGLIEEMDGGLVNASGAALNFGSYGLQSNSLRVANSPSDASKRSTIVHELTHAIQDWYDLDINILAAETDAAICGAVAEHASGQRAQKGIVLFDKAFAAAAFVFQNKTAAGHTPWTDAYTAVEEQVKLVYPNWHESAGLKEAPAKGARSKTPGEPEQFRDALRKVTAAQPRPGSTAGSAAH